LLLLRLDARCGTAQLELHELLLRCECVRFGSDHALVHSDDRGTQLNNLRVEHRLRARHIVQRVRLLRQRPLHCSEALSRGGELRLLCGVLSRGSDRSGKRVRKFAAHFVQLSFAYFQTTFQDLTLKLRGDGARSRRGECRCMRRCVRRRARSAQRARE
jgi:hypothetical protein